MPIVLFYYFYWNANLLQARASTQVKSKQLIVDKWEMWLVLVWAYWCDIKSHKNS